MAVLAVGVVVPASAAGDTRIHDVQGTTRLSELDGQQVTDVPGVVTAIRAFGSARGFWIQDPEPDANPATSEGILVFTGSSTPNVAVGDSVLVSGTVDEFYIDAPPDESLQQSTTELTRATWTVQSSGNALPAAENVGPRTVPEAMAPDAGGENVEGLPLRPTRFAIDYWESREGMRVRVDDARAVSPTSDFNELFITTKPRQNPSENGGTIYTGYRDSNTGRLKIESLIPFSQRPFPQANVNDTLAGETSGPVDYDQFGGYNIQATALGEHVSGGLQPEQTRPQKARELAVATYNVENLSPNDDQAKFDLLAQGVTTALASPDIVSLEEIQDNNGTTNDAVVASDVTLQRFIDAIVAAGGPRYEWRAIDPVDDQDGGAPGGNIRVAFLFNPDRVSFVDRPGGDATTPVAVTGRHKPALSVSPGRINPASEAWTASRKPLAGEFTFRGKTVFVVANHFNSKGGDQPMYGRFQPPTRSSETQRVAQANEVNEFVKQIQRVDRLANIVVLGDINDFQFSPAVRELTSDHRLIDLMNLLPRDERYSYVFEGNSQALDHVLMSGAMLPDYDVVHVNAEFADQASDHDPQVVRLTLLG
ncbi:MAG: endonuclease/exonuclease/phosphatase family protein [Actinophytocola sp.]|uniref:endonuclease/exonuclease/phosphatase family protein n=1 Tax=Actinophytocola sp. TaxID=1872138 RepID=UPI003D6A1CF7